MAQVCDKIAMSEVLLLSCGFAVLRRDAIDVIPSSAICETQLVRCHSYDIAMDEMEAADPFGHTSVHLVPRPQ